MRPRLHSDIAAEILDLGRLESFKVIDAHGHMGRFSGIYFPKPEAPAVVDTMDRCGVEWLVFAHHDAMQNPDLGNPRAQQAVDAFPRRLLAYCALSPNYPDTLNQWVARFPALRGFAGYKLLAAYYKAPITLPACEPLWRHAHEAQLPVLLHTWGGDTCAGCRQVDEIATRYPQARILMGHSQFGDWDNAIELARRHPNVYCELCAAYSANGVIKKMVDAGIEDKVLYGTDIPWFDPMHGIGCVIFADITDTARRKILRDNAARIFQRWIA
ncbi:MAG TPA: TatD family hydrolase [Candidatus Brocadiia bacterium]|nr:TatD family hydrolase [Candidatus Brocadiia bacterium]